MSGRAASERKTEVYAPLAIREPVSGYCIVVSTTRRITPDCEGSAKAVSGSRVIKDVVVGYGVVPRNASKVDSFLHVPNGIADDLIETPSGHAPSTVGHETVLDNGAIAA